MIAVAVIAAAWVRSPHPCRFGAAGGSGLVLFAGSSALIVAVEPEPPLAGALAWSGYVLAVDAAVYTIRGRSIIRNRPEAFLWLAVLSIFLWLPFEWWNLRLAAWYRAGYPPGVARLILLGWSCACIWPALMETADLILAVRSRPTARCPARSAPGSLERALVSLAGAGCLIAPHIVPRLDLGEHLAALAAVGLLLLLDPLNLAAGRPSAWADWVAGRRDRILALALSGAVCGALADGLNHWSAAKWHVISTVGSGWKPFEMPLLAYPLLPVFGLQAFAMYVFASGVLRLPAVRLGGRTVPGPTASGTGGAD